MEASNCTTYDVLVFHCFFPHWRSIPSVRVGQGRHADQHNAYVDDLKLLRDTCSTLWQRTVRRFAQIGGSLGFISAIEQVLAGSFSGDCSQSVIVDSCDYSEPTVLGPFAAHCALTSCV